MRFILIIAFLGLSSLSQAQQLTALVTGRLAYIDTREPAAGFRVELPAHALVAYTDSLGIFTFPVVPYGSYKLILKTPGHHDDTLSIRIRKDTCDLGLLYIAAPARVPEPVTPGLPIIEEQTMETSEDEASARIYSPLYASRDAFQYAVAFTLSPYHFRPRGYERNLQQVCINGISMNDLSTGEAYWSQWGGLNDVFRNTTSTYGLQFSESGFGGLAGTSSFDIAAADQRKQTSITYSIANRQYAQRLMLTHGSGLSQKGWAWSLSASGRWAEKGNFPGAFYRSLGAYLGISKLFGNHEIDLVTFGNALQRGKTSPVTSEVSELAGDPFYNPNWGYQDGKERNARIAAAFQPAVILRHKIKLAAGSFLITSVAYQRGKNSNSSLDWFHGQDPRPDYYRYMPSWQYVLHANDPERAKGEASAVANSWKQHTSVSQIDWDRLYDANYNNIETIPNAGSNNMTTGRRSVYVQSADVVALSKLSLSSRLQWVMNDYVTIHAGVSLLRQQNKCYKEVIDLLGGDFYLNRNQFAEQQFSVGSMYTEYDMNNPNSIIREGEKFSYHYGVIHTATSAWLQLAASFNRFDLFLAGRAGRMAIGRTGYFRNGLYQDSSYGAGRQLSLPDHGLKAGVTAKLNGRNYLFLNAAWMYEPLLAENIYISPRTRDQQITGNKNSSVTTLEAGYLLRSPRMQGRAVFYATRIANAVEILRFYSDDDRFRSFVSYVLHGVSTGHTGAELALQLKLSPVFSLAAVAAIGQAFYTAGAKASVYKENDTTTTPLTRDVYIGNHYLGTGPQSVYSLTTTCRTARSWNINISLSRFTENYAAIAPDRRTQEAAGLTTPGSAGWHQLLDQERLPPFFVADIFLAKTFLLSRYARFLPRNMFLQLNIGVNNVLNNRGIITGGFEQQRFDFVTGDSERFPLKYFHGPGRTYFVNLSFRR